MSIMFGGGEVASFNSLNAVEVATAGTFDDARARGGIHVKKGGHLRTSTMSFLPDIWVHFNVSIDLLTPSAVAVGVANNLGEQKFAILADGSVLVNGTSIGTVPIVRGLLNFDIHLKGGSDGLIEIYIGEQIMFSRNGSYPFDNLQSLTLKPWGFDENSDDTGTVYSEVIIANEVTLGYHLNTLVFTGVGAQSGWVGNTSTAHEAINEFVTDLGTYIHSQNAGTISTWETSNLPAGTTNIRAVIISGMAKNSALGPKNLDGVARISGVNYFQSMSTISIGYTPTQAIFNINPVTSAAWQLAEINGAEFGLRSKV